MRTFPAFAAVIGLLACVPAAAAPGEAPRHTAPLKLLRTLHPVVDVRINGKGPFRLVFDTGSPVTFISQRAAQAAGLVTPQALQAPTLLGMRGQRTAETVEIGGATVSNFPLLVLDHPVIEILGQVDGPVDGIVGHTFFSRFVTTIDYQKEELSLVPTGHQPGDPLSGLLSRLGGPRSAPPPPRAAAALWGFSAGKPATDEAPGLPVRSVVPGSPAHRAGLRAGDRILTIESRWVDSQEDLYDAAALFPPGTPVRTRIRRGSREQELTIRPVLGL